MAELTNKKLSEILGSAIMRRRQKMGFTQLEFAEKLHIEQHSVSRIEKGIIAPKMSRLQEIADLLECTVADLFRQTDTPAFAKAQEICHLLEELSPEMQDVVVDLVENTVYTLKKIDKRQYSIALK